jgi:hypothetical protein
MNNVQIGAMNMNVGNDSDFTGPATIQADSKFEQRASNFSFSKNFKDFFGIGFPL